VGKFLDEAAFFEFFEHLEEGAAVVLLEVERAGEFVEGDGVISKLKKTQDVIRAQGGFGGHDAGPFLGAKGSQTDFSHFFENRCNFFQLSGVS
jgi:hypothetical protein